jgi:hypothetical protein
MLEYGHRTCSPRLRGRFPIKTLSNGGARADLDGDGVDETIQLLGRWRATLSVNGKRVKLMPIARVSLLPAGKTQLLIVDSGQDGQTADYRIVRWANGRLRTVGPLLEGMWNPYVLGPGRLGFLHYDCGAYSHTEYEIRKGRLIKVVDRLLGKRDDRDCVD